MKTKDFSFSSATGVCRINGTEFLPEGDVKAVVLIHHGMAEHIGRYSDYVQHLTEKGYAVFMHNMANHGKSNQDPKLLGYFGEKDGYKNLVKDLKSVYDLAKRNFPIKKYLFTAIRWARLSCVALIALIRVQARLPFIWAREAVIPPREWVRRFQT